MEMIKARTLVLLVFLLFPQVQLAQTSRAGTPSNRGETRYFLRLFNCDDSCGADVWGGFVSSIGFRQDTGWIDVIDLLQDGRNQIEFSVENESAGIAYGFQIRKNQTMLFEQICGRAGVGGCENNRTHPKGIAKKFNYEVRISPEERPLAYTRWLAFYTAFRAAVNKRDRVALRRMIAFPFPTQEGELKSADDVIRSLGWEVLQSDTASGTKRAGFSSRGRPQRCTEGIFCFEYGRDGRWRLSEQGENELGD